MRAKKIRCKTSELSLGLFVEIGDQRYRKWDEARMTLLKDKSQGNKRLSHFIDEPYVFVVDKAPRNYSRLDITD